MKAMMMKDINFLKNQKQFFGAIVIMLVLFSVVQDNPYFAISYVTLMFSILSLTTMSYDDYENGMCYLMTLPIRRRDYVKEKYLFGILSSISGLACASAFTILSTHLKGGSFSFGEWKAVALACFVIIVAALAVTTPLQLKFGVERSRMVIMGVYGFGCLAVFVIVKLGKAAGLDISAILDSAFVENLTTTVWGIGIVSMVVLIVSYLISARILEKREF